MSLSIELTSSFEKQLKSLVKKYPSLRTEFQELIEGLKINPFLGQLIGHHCFKIRLAISSKGKGKRGGARVITYVQVEKDRIFLLSIYDKSEQENLPYKAILELLSGLE